MRVVFSVLLREILPKGRETAWVKGNNDCAREIKMVMEEILNKREGKLNLEGKKY